jgi:cytoskeletal protein CcmA (bactofilin family)
MACESELIYSIYADGELDPETADRVEAHLALCESCRTLLADLREESAAISQALRLSESLEHAAPRQTAIGLSHFAWILAAVAIATLGVHTLFAELSRLRPPAALAWLDPTSPWFQLSLIPSGLVSLLRGGVTMFHQNLTIAVVAIFATACVRILRRRPALLAAGMFALTFMPPFDASATEMRFPKSKDGFVIVPEGETIDDTLLIAGEAATIEGDVKGDVIAAGERIRVKGAVGGSLICFAKELEVDGEINGDVYSMTEFVYLNGAVRRNVHIMAQRVGLRRESDVARDVFIFAEGTELKGRIGGDARAFGRWIEIAGHVGRNLRFKGERLLVATTGYVGGDATADVKDKSAVTIPTGDKTAELGVHGNVKINEHRPVTTGRFTRPRFYVWQLVRLAAACLTGIVLFWLAPGLFAFKPQSGASLLRSGGVGFAALVTVPIAALLAGTTLIGLPLALLALMGWLAAMYIASVFMAALIGRSLLRSGDGNGRSYLLALCLGLLILRIVVNLPWIGGIVGFVVLVVGMGMAISQTASVIRRVRAS